MSKQNQKKCFSLFLHTKHHHEVPISKDEPTIWGLQNISWAALESRLEKQKSVV